MAMDRDTRQAFRAEDTPPELVEVLAQADYSHLPEISAEQLARFQRAIDAKIKPGTTFRSVSRAKW